MNIVDAATGLLDMAYGNVPTPTVHVMRSDGFPVADGVDMLVGQAIECFRIWTGAAVPPAVFRKAAEDELLRRAEEESC